MPALAEAPTDALGAMGASVRDVPYPVPVVDALGGRPPAVDAGSPEGGTVVSDEELEEHLSRVEYAKLVAAEPDPALVERLVAIEESSAYIHRQFARHGAVVERPATDEDRTLAERLAAIERRLAEIERVLRDGATVRGEEPG